MTSTLTPMETQQKVAAQRASKKARRKIEDQFKQYGSIMVEYASPTQFVPNDYNPNRMTEDDFLRLVYSIVEDGFTRPILAKVQDNGNIRIIDGEHRWRAGTLLELPEIPYIALDMDELQARLATIRRNTIRGTHDVDKEAEIFVELQQAGMLNTVADSLLMTDKELDRILAAEPVAAYFGMQAEEYSDAWVPSMIPDNEIEEYEQGLRTTQATYHVDAQGNPLVVGMTKAALDEGVVLRDKMVAAESEMERVGRQDTVIRILLNFKGEDAMLVQNALGDEPAERLVQFCRWEEENAEDTNG